MDMFGIGMTLWSLAIFVLGVCLLVSPLMIWQHTKATSRKLDRVIELLSERSDQRQKTED